MTRDKAEGVPLGNSCQDKLRLHHGEAIADAQAWPPSKRNVGIARTIRRAFGCEAIWVEPLRLLPVCRVPMHPVCHEKDQTIARNRIAPNLVSSNRMADDKKGRGIETHGFLNHPTRVGKIFQTV